MAMYLIIAARNLLQARRRTALVSIALAVVTMLLVILMALSQGLSDQLIRSATMLLAGHVNVAGFYKAKPSDAFPMVTKTDEIRATVEKVTPGLDYVVDRHRGWAKIVSETGRVQAAIAGVDVADEGRLLDRLRLAEEHEYKDDGRAEVVGDPRDLDEPGTIMLFASQAKRLEISIGDVVTIVTENMSGSTNTGQARVVAIGKDIGFMTNWSAFVNKDTVRDLYSLGKDTSGVVMVYLEDPNNADTAMGALRTGLEAEGFRLMEHQPDPFWRKFEVVAGEDWTGQKLDLSTWLDELGGMKYTVDALNSISFGLVGVLIIIIVIGIMNTMWIAVRERTNEIGTLRAIGMGRLEVLTMFLTEALLLGFVATTTGALVGAGIASGLDAAHLVVESDAIRAILLSDTLHLRVQVSQIITAVLIFTGVTAAAAFWPATRAARLQPVTAIHHMG